MTLPCERCRKQVATRFQRGDARWLCAQCSGLGVWSHDDQAEAMRETLEEAIARAECAERELREARIEIADLQRRLHLAASTRINMAAVVERAAGESA